MFTVIYEPAPAAKPVRGKKQADAGDAVGPQEVLQAWLMPGQAVAIASGTDHLAILLQNGKVLTLGSSDQGQLGRIAARWWSVDRSCTARLQHQIIAARAGTSARTAM